jgi:hypothetical protein
MSMLEIQTLDRLLGPALIGVFLRSSVLVLTGAFFVILLRRRTAELRHFICHAVLYSLLLLPVIEYTAPPLRHPSAALTALEVTALEVAVFRKPANDI